VGVAKYPQVVNCSPAHRSEISRWLQPGATVRGSGVAINQEHVAAVSLTEVRQRPTAIRGGPPAASARNETADSRRATTTLPTSGHRQPGLGHSRPNRVVGVNTNTRWARQPPRAAAPLHWWRAESLALEGRAVEGFIIGLPRQLTDQWVATSEGWRWRRLQGGLRGSSPWLRR
jgi:hypothetical protein